MKTEFMKNVKSAQAQKDKKNKINHENKLKVLLLILYNNLYFFQPMEK